MQEPNGYHIHCYNMNAILQLPMDKGQTKEGKKKKTRSSLLVKANATMNNQRVALFKLYYALICSTVTFHSLYLKEGLLLLKNFEEKFS